MGDECSVNVLLLRHKSPEQFGECLCQTGCITFSGVYVFIRDIFAYVHFGILLWDAMMIIVEPKDKVYVFFDFWNQALLFLTAEIGVYNVVSRWSEYDMDENCCWDYTPWYSRFLWALYSAVLPSTVLSSIVYWRFRDQSMPFIGTLAEGMGAGILSERARTVGVVMASFSPIVALADFVLVAFPLRLVHMFYFILWYWFYVGVTAAFQMTGWSEEDETVPVYSVLDWRNPSEAALHAFIGLVIGVAFYITFWGFSRLKDNCRRPCPYQ